MNLYRRVGKRLLDIAMGLVALPLVGLATCVVAPAIKLEDRGPLLYRSQRRGRNGEPFTILKFRSMTVNAPDLRNADMSTLNSDDDPRVTRVGRIIRKLSVDELPQIINVLRGDMSFVGPRPNMASQRWEDLDEVERKRVEVHPGITGLAQAYHRNSATTEQKYELDCQYVDNVTFLGDLRILAKTVTSVLAAKNINASPDQRANPEA